MAGHVRRRGKGWQARMPNPALGGAAKVERTFRTRREAEEWLTAQGAAVLRGEYIDPRLADRPWREVAEAWQATWVDLKPTTRGGYESILRHHLLPAWGGRKVGGITHEAVQKWVAGLSAAGLAPGTVRSVYSVFRSATNAGVRLGLVRVNPCAAVRLPRTPHHEMLALTAEEVRAVAEAIHPAYRALVYAAAYTGLRAGELGGLRRRNLDLLHSRLVVAEALKEVGGRLFVGPPKTHERRAVSLPTFLRDMLAEHLSTFSPGGAGPEAYVFQTVTGAPIRHNQFYKRYFKPAVRAALPKAKHGLRFHDLRHTCASLLIAAGAHPKAIQVRLGHSSIQITMDRYGHLLPSVDDALAGALDATHAAAAQPANVRALHG